MLILLYSGCQGQEGKSLVFWTAPLYDRDFQPGPTRNQVQVRCFSKITTLLGFLCNPTKDEMRVLLKNAFLNCGGPDVEKTYRTKRWPEDPRLDDFTKAF